MALLAFLLHNVNVSKVVSSNSFLFSIFETFNTKITIVYEEISTEQNARSSKSDSTVSAAPIPSLQRPLLIPRKVSK